MKGRRLKTEAPATGRPLRVDAGSLIARMGAMTDAELVNLRDNAERLVGSVAAGASAAATELLPSLAAEIAARKTTRDAVRAAARSAAREARQAEKAATARSVSS